MPYNEHIGQRIKNIVAGWQNATHKNMFGGVCHLLNGNMFCGIYKDYLILRLGAEKGNRALTQPHVQPFDITGRPMKGWVMVATEGFATDDKLADWLGQAREFASTLAPK